MNLVLLASLNLENKLPQDHSNWLLEENGLELLLVDGNLQMMFQSLLIKQLWDNGQLMLMLLMRSKDWKK